MPRADTSAPVGEGAVLQAVVTGLIARVEGSPLMGRAPTACTPQEQARLVTLLSGLSALRATLAALSSVPDVPAALVEEAWPELAAALAPAARAPRPTTVRGPSNAGSPRPARSTARRGGSQKPAADTPSEAPAEVTETPDSAAVAPAARPESAQDLRAAVRSVLRADSRPLSGARIASLVQEVAPQTTREQVYDTLYHSADLFRKTSQGWELVAR